MRTLLIASLLLPTIVFADGGNDEPPAPPASDCKGAQVFDEKSGKCVDAKESSLDRDQLYATVRQLAWAGRYHDAQNVLDAMDPQDPGRLTYMGFTHRKLGNNGLAMMFYREAIDRDPANIMARSYMGQGLVEQGQVTKAIAQLQAIRRHGGSGTWSETSLRNAIATGATYNY